MTIIGLKTGDNGIQGLSLAHTHHHRYPIPTRRGHHRCASSPPLPVLVSPFILSSPCPSFHNCSSVSPLPPSSLPNPFQTFFFFTLLNFETHEHCTHTHTHFLIISSFWHSLTSSPLFFIHICAESCEMSPNRDKSSVPGKSGSDITDTVSHTRTKTHNESSVK